MASKSGPSKRDPLTSRETLEFCITKRDVLRQVLIGKLVILDDSDIPPGVVLNIEVLESLDHIKGSTHHVSAIVMCPDGIKRWNVDLLREL